MALGVLGALLGALDSEPLVLQWFGGLEAAKPLVLYRSGGRLVTILGRSWPLLELSWGAPGRSWVVLGSSWDALGRSWGLWARNP